MSGGPTSAPFAAHGDAVEQLLRLLLRGTETVNEEIESYLDGQASADARRLLSLDFRRQAGAFFTPSALRNKLADILRSLPGSTYLDPACGAGDLLVAAAQTLPLGRNLFSTIRLWSNQLTGWDLYPEFTSATRLRLTLLAAARHRDEHGHVRSAAVNISDRFVGITTGDAFTLLSELSSNKRPDIVVINPPYTRVPTPTDYKWSTGKTSSAAVLVARSLNALPLGGHLVAILPDSLRSGSNFHRWRQYVETKSEILSIETVGLFDAHADIDVFILVARVGHDSTKLSTGTWWQTTDAGARVSDHFTVQVGAVVDNRDPFTGPDRPFLVARGLPESGAIGIPTRRRKFHGRVVAPPFVAVRRTSRPSAPGRPRAAGVIVEGAKDVAVDNHLLVLKPKDNSDKTCIDLVKLLELSQITDILDDRIRCRHLTVGALKELPWLKI